MFKQLSLRIVLSLLFFVVSTNSELFQYHFTGNVSHVIYSQFEITYENSVAVDFKETTETSNVFGVTAGRAVDYTFLFDVDRSGFYIDTLGNTVPLYDGEYSYTYKDTTKKSNFDYFYTEFQGTELLPDLTTNDISDMRMGANEIFTKTFPAGSVSGTKSSLTGGQIFHYTQVYNDDPSIADWDSETELTGLEFSSFKQYTTDKKYLNVAMVISKLKLSTIKEVPEPHSIFLLASGILFFALVALTGRRQKQ